MWVPVAAAGLILLVISLLGYLGTTPNPDLGKQHYVSERHTLPLAYIGCVFAAAGLEVLPGVFGRLPIVGGWLGRPAVKYVVLAGIIVSALPKLARPLHDERAGQKEAGQYLEGQLLPDDTLIDPYEWAKFYAGRSLRSYPPDLPNPPVVYAVLRNRDLQVDPGSLLPQLAHARNVANDGRSIAVFQWPPDVPPEAARLRIYRLDNRRIWAAGSVAGGASVPIAGERR